MEFHWVCSGDNRLATAVDRPVDSDRKAAPAVIVIHGLTGQRLGKSYHLVDLGRRLNQHGIACVRFDQSGCGESTGEFCDLTIPGITSDTRAVRQWLDQQPWCDGSRIAYVALSLGALAAVAAEAERPARGLVLWAPVYDMPQVFQRTAKTGLRAILEHQGWVPYRGLRIGKCFVDALGAVDTADLLARSRAPLLLCHSHADDVVGFDQSQLYQRRCEELNRPCRLLEFDLADHDFSDFPDRLRLLAHSVAFLQETLQ